VPDPVTTAKSARESLARGLKALQAENLPPGLVELAEPIAQAMGALHQIERSGGTQLSPHADVALGHTRSALSSLQAQPQAHPAVLAATEAVASSLGLVHALGKMAVGLGPTAPQPAHAAAQPAFPQAQQPQVSTAYQPPAPAPAAFPQANQPFKQGAAPAPGSPLAATFAAPGPAPVQAQPQPRAASAGTAAIVNADLGTHSATNFYKGLSGNDVVDHGGLFVSTYMIPQIGAPVRLKVSLPGGYEFEANAVVRWSRDPSEGGGDAPPGFGAQFTAITQEARQLVYRYVRNREPLFHDDM
jgi:hypothetical protein